MAIFKIRLSRLHEGSPKSISFITHLLFSSSHGFRSGKARSNRKMKKETSIRNPMPAPTAMSSTIDEKENARAKTKPVEFKLHMQCKGMEIEGIKPDEKRLLLEKLKSKASLAG